MKKKIVALILLSLSLSACGDPNYKPEDGAVTYPTKVVVDYVPEYNEDVKVVVFPVVETPPEDQRVVGQGG